MCEKKEGKRIWGLDEKIEKNICFVFETHKEDIQKARYVGISPKGNLKFEIGKKNFVFDPTGNLIGGPYGRTKIATKLFFLDCQKYKEVLETVLYEKDSFFRRIEVGSPTKVVQVMLYFQSRVYEEMEYPVCISLNIKKYTKKESKEEFVKYILDEIRKVKKQSQQWYDRQLTKYLSEVIVYEDCQKEYRIHPKNGAYIYLKKNGVKIKCAVQAESCFTRVVKHEGRFVEEYTYEPICFDEIKKKDGRKNLSE